MTTRIWLIIILVIAVLFRFIGLTKSPASLNWDEVSIGYNAYSILKTGRDEWGELLPLTFKAFGENKLPAMIYASVPSIAVLGLNDLGVRATPAILGVIAVYLIYLLARELFKNNTVALIATGLFAISPWAVHFSRIAFEAGLGVVFLLAMVLALLRAQSQTKFLWVAMGFAVLALYTYNSLRIFLPLLIVFYLINGLIKLEKKQMKTYLLIVVVGVMVCVPIIRELADPSGRIRFGTVAIQSQKSFVEGIAESRGYTPLPSPLPQLIHNKVTHYLYTFSMNYLKTFSTEFLFFTGSHNSQRSVQGMGMLYWFELPLIILGLVALKSQKGMVKQLLLPWLLLAPIPSAITIDAPSSVRLLSLLPALILIESLGALSIYKFLVQSRIVATIATLAIVWNVGYFLYLLHYVSPVKFASDWQYGYKEAVAYATSHYDEASRIYLPTKYGEPYIYTLFYTRYDPRSFQTGEVERTTDPTGWVHVHSFDKYRFSDYAGLESPAEIVARGSGRLVLITPFAMLPGEYKRELSIKAPSWEIMFEGTVQEGKL